MDCAIEEARKALEKKEVPVGAVVVYENKIIGRGHNLVETLQDATAHAEIIAIGAGGQYLKNWRLYGAQLIVTVEPCLMCFGAILHSRIKTLCYAVSQPKFGAFSLFNLPIPKTLKIIKGIKEKEITTLLQNFFATLRTKH
ncbi:MAG: nucleoside deaminase [Planctomycetota bacterium]